MKKVSLLFILLLLASFTFAQNQWMNQRTIDPGSVAIRYKPGKILDNGKTIWLCGEIGSPATSWSFRSTDGGKTWLKGTAVNGQTAGIDAIDANTAIMGLTDGSIVKTTDGGVTWKKVHSYTGGEPWFDGVKFVTKDIVIGFGDGDATGHYYVCRSTDGGNTFTQIPYSQLPSAGRSMYAIFTYGTPMDVYGNNVWLTLYPDEGSDYYLVKSTDAGVTWKAIKLDSTTSAIYGISFLNEKTGMMVNGGFTTFLTQDGGTTWTKVTTPTGMTVRNAYALRGKNRFYILGNEDNVNKTPVIYWTSDLGVTWERDFLPLPDNASYIRLYAAVMLDENTGFAMGRDRVIYQKGAPEINKNLVIATEVWPQGLVYKPGVVLDNGNTIWFCGHEPSGNRDTYPFLSTDGGKTFKTGTKVSGRTAGIDAFNSTTALMATADGKIMRTTDGGTTWTKVHEYKIGGDVGFFDGLKILDANTVIAFGDGETPGKPYFCRSTDKGLTFTAIPNEKLPTVGETYYGYFSYGSCITSYRQSVWIATYGNTGTMGYVLRSNDAGQSWWVSHRLSFADRRFLSIYFPNGTYGMAVDNSRKMYLIINGGDIWVPIDPPTYPTGTVSIYSVSGLPESNVFIAGGIIADTLDKTKKYYGVFYTNDLGKTWKQIPAPYSGKGGSSDYIIGGTYFNESFGYAFSNGGFVLKLGTGTPTSVDNPINVVSIPKEFALEQNYPNPFNPSTNIKFHLNKTEHVKLVIYDALGKEVATLIDDNIVAGDHNVIFNADRLSSGVYFYTLKAGNKIETRKMMLMK
jgi:photosystem II stability/assembly factor-like uncharacterized protein